MDEELKFEIKPRFNFIYELFMPLGIKLRRELFIFIGIIILDILTNIFAPKLQLDTQVIGISIMTMLKIFYLIVLIVVIVKFFVDLVLKNMQYKNMSYRFYETNLVYEDKFLNQQKKIIKYENIKEVEIRRSVFDRIMGFGIIIISTNAEGGLRSGIIIYGIKNSNEVYDKINELVHNTEKVSKKEENVVEEKNEKTQKLEEIKEEIHQENYTEESEKDFKDSLKNVNDGENK